MFQSKTYVRWLVSYVFILLFVIVSVGSVFLFFIVRESTKKYEDERKRHAEQVVKTLDANIMALNSIGADLYISQEITGLTKTEQSTLFVFDAKQSSNLMNLLQIYNDSVDIVEYITVIQKDLNLAINKRGSFSIHSFINNFCDAADERWLTENIDSYERFTVLPMLYSKTGELRYITIVKSIDFRHEVPKTFLVFMVSFERIQRYIQSSLRPEDCFFIEYEGEFLPVSGYENSGELGRMMAEQEFQNGESVRLGDSIYMRWDVDAAYLPFKYVCLLSNSHSMMDVASGMRLLALTITAIFTVGLVFALILSNTYYQPLKKLVSVFSPPDGKRERYVDDYKLISTEINSLIRENEYNTVKLTEYSDIVNKKVLTDIVEGNFGGEDSGLISGLRMENLYEKYCHVLLIAGASPRFNAAKTEKRAAEVLQGMEYRTLVNNDRQIIALIFTDGDVGSDSLEKTLREGLEAGISDKFLISAGSEPCMLHEISAQYHNAKKIMECFIFIGEDGERGLSRYREDNLLYYYFPIDFERRIDMCLRKGDGEEAARLLSELRRENIQVRSLPYNVLKRLIMQLAETGLKVIYDLKLEISQVTDTYHDFQSNMTQDEMWAWLERLFSNVCRANADREPNKNALVVGELIHYVESHFNDSELSLKSLADTFGLPVYTISRVFKNATNCNFIDYLASIRVEYAKTLIRDSALGFDEISRRSGFVSAVTFRSLFKKCTGVTPSDFRKSGGSLD